MSAVEKFESGIEESMKAKLKRNDEVSDADKYPAQAPRAMPQQAKDGTIKKF